ncbi:MarR family winged helix-turn-helix transcriptional regulator [Cohnella candidum]|uniref:MarR family transcriptional regulator n=1 Tax=Cohnella candidum TaxID=2674991 RepID=A0A3G3JVS5_9BACL|nr:MarR family transcriptional regulator [Cohnella candidum]AYQ71951.1 MarR family transcriptional regulator [Cohnella candidum]
MDEQNPIIRITNSLRELNQTYFQTTRKEAEACGITQIQYLMLRLLKQYPKIGLNELSELMHTGASTASGVVDRLVQAGLIERDRLETDRRAVVLKLSPEGERLVEVTSERVLKRLSPLLSLSEEDIGHLLRIHAQIVHILQKAREDS